MLKQVAERVSRGETVSFRPAGNSMAPLIKSRDQVTIAPVNPAALMVDDIVLAKVAGNIYLHLVKAIDPTRHRVQIGNNHGRINGWTSFDRVYGIALTVAGIERTGARAKVAR